MAGQSIIVRIGDVDGRYQKVKSAGAVILHEPQIFPYGEKHYSVEDLGGHVWVFAESVADVEPGDCGGELVWGITALMAPGFGAISTHCLPYNAFKREQ